MPLDNEDRCGMWKFSFDKDYWLTGVCKWHDNRWVYQDKAFNVVLKEFYQFIETRRAQLNKSKVESLTIFTLGTILGAPIWIARKIGVIK